MKDPYGGIPVVDTDPYGGLPVVDDQPAAPQGNVIDPLGVVNPLSGYGIKVAGEAAAGANEAIVGFFDLLAKTGNLAAGGYSGGSEAAIRLHWVCRVRPHPHLPRP